MPVTLAAVVGRITVPCGWSVVLPLVLDTRRGTLPESSPLAVNPTLHAREGSLSPSAPALTAAPPPALRAHRIRTDKEENPMTTQRKNEVMPRLMDVIRNVSDISQIAGEHLADIAVPLSGHHPADAYDRLRHIAHSIGYTVEEDHLPATINGDCSFEQRCIRVEVRNDDVQQVETLAHELTLALIHESFTDRAHAEQARPCLFCGTWFETCDPDNSLCEDCEFSDCAYCGFTTYRPLLSESLACGTCEGRDDAA
jgi:hypothetical protein